MNVIPVMIVPILARPELLYRMLDSVDFRIQTLIIIDNGCVVDSQQANIDCADRVEILRMPSNLGVASSWNLGIKATPFAPWWLICGFDVTWPCGALQEVAERSSSQSLTFFDVSPKWAAFTIGDRIVDSVGLFDEALHPAYFEDDDYERRIRASGARISVEPVQIRHDNSSTLSAGNYASLNGHTFPANAAYFADKVEAGDFSEGRWTLARRRRQTWD